MAQQRGPGGFLERLQHQPEPADLGTERPRMHTPRTQPLPSDCKSRTNERAGDRRNEKKTLLLTSSSYEFAKRPASSTLASAARFHRRAAVKRLTPARSPCSFKLKLAYAGTTPRCFALKKNEVTCCRSAAFCSANAAALAAARASS